MNINLTDEQAKFVEKTTKTYGFANRSEFLRALLRYVYKINPNLVKTAASSPFAVEVEKKLPTLEKIKKKIVPILKKNDVEFAGIFGSYARGEAKLESDLDLLIRYRKDNEISLLDLIGLQNELSDTLGIKVDLIPEDSLHKLVRPQAAKELITLYGQRQSI